MSGWDDMDITSINSQTSAALAANSNPGSSELGRTEFLQLLVTQLQNQDPLNPLDSAEYAAQLAQFSSVEQLVNINSGIESLVQTQQISSTGLNNTIASTLTGKTVSAFSDRIHLGEERTTDVNFKLSGIATDVQIEILDSTGNVIRSESLSNFGQGDHKWTWDGTTTNGNSVPEGTYQVRINAANGENPISSLAVLEGKVSKVRYTNGGVEINCEWRSCTTR